MYNPDSRYFPHDAAIAGAYVTIDDQTVSNASVINWRQLVARRQHSFNLIGTQYVSTGNHTIVFGAATIGAATFFCGE